MVYKNILSLDTVKAFTLIYLNTHDLVSCKKWIVWKNTKNDYIEFNKKEGNLRFKYLPTFNYLEVQFSASKVINGTNAHPFNFEDRNLLVQYINVAINLVLPQNIDVPNFNEWKINELHTFIDYKCTDQLTAKTYQNCLAKSNFLRCTNTLYKTGNQARNNSYCNNIYIKEDEIKYRLNNKPESVNDKEMEILLNKKKSLRYEVQAKKQLLKYLFGINRKVKDLINYETCKKIINAFIIKNGFNNAFLYRNRLYQVIDATFSQVKSRNIKNFIEIYNEKGLEEAKKIFKKSTINTYFRNLRSANINPIYLPNTVSKTIDFSSYVSAATNTLIERIIENVIAKIICIANSFISIIYHIYLIRLNHKNKPDAYYYEENG